MNSKLYKTLSQKPAARKWLAERDIAFFARYYLSEAVNTQIGDLHKEWIDLMQNYKKIAIAAPRGHAKSTWFSYIYILHQILFNQRKFIILISDTVEQAEKQLGEIVEQLETNEKIIRDFGNIAGFIPDSVKEKKKWTVKDIITLTGVRVTAAGWKTKLRGVKHKGLRPDLIVVDDLENDENVESEDQRLKVKNVFGNSIMNLGHDTTQIIVIGTILHFDSLLMSIINNPGPGWKIKLYKAIKEDNTPLWPERWTMEMFQEKIDDPVQGRIKFEKEFMNNPLDPSTQIIVPKEFYTGSIDLNEFDLFGYIDPAISEKETADFSAVVTVGRHKVSGKIYVIEPKKMRGKVFEQMELVFNEYKKYRYRQFGVESVAYQKALFQIISKESAERQMYLPVVEVEVDKDKVRRATTIVPYIENGTIVFNSGHVEFISELVYFPKGSHDDYVDAFVGACMLAINSSGSNVTVRSGRSVQYEN